MTPLISPDFTKVDAGITVYDKVRARVKVTKRTPFINESRPDQDGNTHTLIGVRYNLELQGILDREGNLDDELQGKTVSPFKCWMHSEGGWQFSKPFLMAAAGYTMKQEDEANEELFAANNWEIDGEVDAPPENIIVGEGFDVPVDRLVDVTLTKKVTTNKSGGDDYENQEFSNWAPVK